jgi:dolichol-phosphate mannosyltransferase
VPCPFLGWIYKGMSALSYSAAAAAELPEPLPATASVAELVFVVPAYNEEANIARLLADIEARPTLYAHDRSRVIVVDDGSSDATAEIVSSYSGPLPVQLVRLDRNQGPGAAFRAGFAVALSGCDDTAFVVTLEADTTSDLDALPRMLAHANAGAELVLASVHGGGRMLNVGPLRRTLSRGAGWFARVALGVEERTVSSFYRVYRASLLRSGIHRYGDSLIRESGFACKAELLGKLRSLGAHVAEVPVDVDGARRIGESKMPVLRTMLGYWRLLARQRLGLERASA